VTAADPPHHIRLHGPWECCVLSRSVRLADGSWQETRAGLPPSGRVRIPTDGIPSLGEGCRDRILLTRRFHQPTGLVPDDRVDLVIEGLAAGATVTLNGVALRAILFGQDSVRYDVTRCLQRRNELALEVEVPGATADASGSPPCAGKASQGGLCREIRLEIHAA
jgi:hypothetical protein